MKRASWILGITAALVLGSGCSVRRLAANKFANALAAGGSTFASDNDPELVAQALPFSLKLMESLLAETPRHAGLLRAASSGFTQYAYAFVQFEAERVEDTDLDRARELQARAKALYLRARDYGLRALEVAHAGFTRALEADPHAAVRRLTHAADVPAMYWVAAASAAAIAVDKTDAALIADLPRIAALLDRALELDETFDSGALHSLFITFETVRQDREGDAAARARHHLERAVALSGGQLAGPYVAFAEAVCVPAEDRDGFVAQIERALAVNPDAKPELRLANLVTQKRARWLHSRVDRIFLPPPPNP